MWSEQRIQVSSKSLLLLAASVVVNSAGGKQVRRTGQEKDSVACRDSRMHKRAQSFGKDGWDAATGNLRGSGFQAEEPSPAEAVTGGQRERPSEATRRLHGGVRWIPTRRVRGRGDLQVEKGGLQKLSPRFREGRKKNYIGCSRQGEKPTTERYC